MKPFSPSNRSSSGPVARERLQLLLAHERNATNQPDLVAVLREEILGVIAQRLQSVRHKVRVTMNRGEAVSTLEIDLEFPTGSKDRITYEPRPASKAAA